MTTKSARSVENNVIIWVTIAKFTLEKTKDDMTNITSDTAAT